MAVLRRPKTPEEELRDKRELDEVAERMRACIGDFVYGPWRNKLGKMFLDGHDIVCLNPLRPDKHPGSFRIPLGGPYQGMVIDFAGQVKPGDGRRSVSPLTFHLWLGFTVRDAKERLGMDGRNPDALRKAREETEKFRARAEQNEADVAEKRKSAKWIYTGPGAVDDLRGTPPWSYLLGRGIDLARFDFPVRALRFRPDCPLGRSKKRPAMLAAIVKGSDFVGVHRTFLEEVDGRWIKARDMDDPKLSLGSYAGGAIRLWNGRRHDPETGEIKPGLKVAQVKEPFWIDLTEGIEDGLSVALACPEHRVWVGVSGSNMKGLWLPRLCEGVRFWKQNKDAPGSAAAASFDHAVENVLAQGKRVQVVEIPAEWGDPNEVLQAKGAAE